MYCQGCGSKVSKGALVNYIKKINDNIDLADSLIINNKSLKILQTIDHIKLFSSINPLRKAISSGQQIIWPCLF